MRRRPVPREWREDNHSLRTYHHRRYAAMRGGGSYVRAGGVCSCGEKFGLANDNHTMHTADVVDAWKDHVEDVYYESGERPSARAARGILRRAEKRGRTLPSHLSAALEQVAQTTTTGKADG